MYWEDGGQGAGGEDGDTGAGSSPLRVASAGLLSAAAVAFCLKKDSDDKGNSDLICALIKQ